MIIIASLLVLLANSKLVTITEDQFRIPANRDMLVLFASDCLYSLEAEQHFQNLSNASFHGPGEKEPKVVLVKVSNEFALENKLQGLPAVRLYMKGQSVDYLGNYGDLKDWVSYKTKQALYHYGDAKQLKRFISDKPVVLLYHNRNETSPWDDPGIEELKHVANIVFEKERRNFKLVHSISVPELYSAKSQLILIRNKQVVEYDGELRADPIIAFLIENFYPLLMEYNQVAIDWVFNENPEKIPILFIVSTEALNEEQSTLLEGELSKYRKKLRIVKVDGANPFYQRVLQFLGISPIEQEVTETGIYDTLMSYIREASLDDIQFVVNQLDNKKYRLSQKPSSAAINKFIGEYLSGTHPRHYRCNNQTLPASTAHYSFANCKSYKEILPNSVIYFYADWCRHCDLKVLEAAATKVPYFKFVAIDGYNNEVKHVEIKQFPTIRVKLLNGYTEYPHELPADEENLVRYLNAVIQKTEQQSDL